MNQQLREYFDTQAQELENAVQQALQACGGDPMSALRSLVIANTFLMEENEQLKAPTTPFGLADRLEARVVDHATTVVLWHLVYQLNGRARIDLVACVYRKPHPH